MNNTPLKYSVIVLLLSFAITSCKKNAPSKSSENGGNISFYAKASGTGVKLANAKSGSIASDQVVVNWTSASIYIQKISFIGTNGNLLDTTITVEKNINLFSPAALAGVIQLPAGSYKDVKVKMLLLKSQKSDRAFILKGTFKNTKGGQDSLFIASSFPFEVNLGVTDITINAADAYKATFNFNLDKGLTGISTAALQTARHYGTGSPLLYVIAKGGSDVEPFYDQVVSNWQNVASVTVSK